MTTALITGANKGIGLETARQLVVQGLTVWLGGRDERRAEEAARRVGARPVQIDVTDDESIRAAAKRVAANGDGLDVLVNNAGIAGRIKPFDEVTGDDVAVVFDTNLLGVVRVTNAFLPLLRASTNGVIVNVGSGLGSLTRVSDPDSYESKFPSLAYAASKSALTMLTIQYARAFPDLRVNIVDPGHTATDLNGHRGPQPVEDGAIAAVRAATVGRDGPTGAFYDRDGTVPW